MSVRNRRMSLLKQGDIKTDLDTHTHTVLLGVSVIFPLSVSCNVSASHAVAQAAVR